MPDWSTLGSAQRGRASMSRQRPRYERCARASQPDQPFPREQTPQPVGGVASRAAWLLNTPELQTP